MNIYDKIICLREDLPLVSSRDPDVMIDYVEVASITYEKPTFFGFSHKTVTQNVRVRGKEPEVDGFGHYLIGYLEVISYPGPLRRSQEVIIRLDHDVIKDYSAPNTKLTRSSS